MLGDAGEHFGSDFNAIMKRPNVVWKLGIPMPQLYVGTALGDRMPADPQERLIDPSRPSRWASGSRRSADQTDRFGDGLGFLHAIGDHAKRERVGIRLGLIFRPAIGEDPRNVRDLGDPAAVILALGFDIESQVLVFRAALGLSVGHSYL